MILKIKIPYEGKNIDYLYCVSKYPANYEDIEMPNFNGSIFSGYSDHTIGLGKLYISSFKIAKIIENITQTTNH